MTTIILAVIVGILVLDRLFSFRVDKFDYDFLKMEAKANKQFQAIIRKFDEETTAKFERISKHLNENADRENEHVRAFQELADNLGYCIHIEEGMVHTGIPQNISPFQAIPMKKVKRLVVHKKVEEPKKRTRRR